MTLAPLHRHQQTALDDLKQSILAGHRRPLLQASTGFGKTVVSAHIVAGARSKHKRVAFCVPTLGLVDQTFERFRENGIDPVEMGIMQADHPWSRPGAPIQIATAQTLSRRTLPDVDVVVIDEAHIRFSVYDRWMGEAPDKIFIGLSATPWAKGLGRQFNDLVKTTPLSELIELGFLSKFRVFAPSKPDLDGIRTVAGDYHEGELAGRMNKPQLVADIVSTWLSRAKDLPTLCFAAGRAHAKSIHDEFASVGVPVAYVDADTPREDREAIGQALATGAIKVVCNIGTLTTGIDWDVRAIILARPTKSESLFVQIVGRGLRTAHGKTECLILDHSDTTARLGFVTDIDHDALDQGKAIKSKSEASEKRKPLPKCCSHCTALMPVLAQACEVCGTPLPKPVFSNADGDLEEIVAKHGKKHATARERLEDMGKQSVFSQLTAVRLERGRSSGWAVHSYKDIFGIWPRGLSELPADPTPEILSWVRSKDIRFARSRSSAGGKHAVA